MSRFMRVIVMFDLPVKQRRELMAGAPSPQELAADPAPLQVL